MSLVTALTLLAMAAGATLAVLLAIGVPAIVVWLAVDRLRGRLDARRPRPVDTPVQTRWMDAREVAAAQQQHIRRASAGQRPGRATLGVTLLG